jgi:hypothetical protein
MRYGKVVTMVGANAEFEILRYCAVGASAVNIGVFLLDLTKGRLYWKLRRDWSKFASKKAADYLCRIERGLREAQEKMGAAGVLRYLGDCLSEVLQLSEREKIVAKDPVVTLAQIFAERIR